MKGLWAAWMAGAFLLGSIPWGWWLTRRRGIDIRAVGSGNIGATNVGRALGFRWGLAVFFLDFAKGLIPVWACRRFVPLEAGWPAWVGLSAVLGHVFSPWLKFRGGKGVATAFGSFIALTPWAAVMAFGVFLIVVGTTSYVALGSLAGALSFVVFTAWMFEQPPGFVLAAGLTALLIGWRHAGNIRRLLRGVEPKVTWGRGHGEPSH